MAGDSEPSRWWDVYTRESLAINVGQKLKDDGVVRTLNQVRLQRGVPKVLFCDNGSEFTSQVMDLWAYHNDVRIDFSRPGKPTDCWETNSGPVTENGDRSTESEIILVCVRI